MRKIFFISSFILVIVFSQCAQKKVNVTQYVDPFICSQGDHGHWHPSALLPGGLVKLGPDTYPGSLTANGDWAHSGYNYADNQVRGFSHFHKGSSGGTTIGDRAGAVALLPFTGNVPEKLLEFYPVIDKNTEKAKPGWYSVYSPETHTKVELTATTRAGMHRYEFANDSTGYVLLHPGNLSNRGFNVELHENSMITGTLNSRGIFYFALQFNRPFEKAVLMENDQVVDGNKVNNPRACILFSFPAQKDNKVLAKLALSAVDINGAVNNLNTEMPGWNFDEIAAQAESTWNDLLQNIMVKGSLEYKTIFYTALFRTYFLPVKNQDVDGRYPGLDKKIHQETGHTHYDNFAFWDSFRTKYPLYSITAPQLMYDITKSILDLYSQVDNYLPFPDTDHPPHGVGFVAQGKNGYIPFHTCRHEHMLAIPTDSYTKGLVDFDMAPMYKGMKQEMMAQMPKRYDKIGFIPKRPDQNCEYSYDNWCVAQVAKGLDKKDDYDYFMKRSQIYRNTWNDEVGFFRARAKNGKWLDFPSDPKLNREKYNYEGSKWHWRWFVLNDVDGLIELVGGPKKFTNDLNYFFENDLYSAGNQPDLQAPFLFNYSGAPWFTQKWVRKILTEPMTQLYGTHQFFPEPIHDRIYKATPDGYLLEMDDDYGCMAAWYVMSAMGLYQVCPGNPTYALTAPIFDQVVLKLDTKFYPGKEFVVEAKNLSPENIYIQSATLDGTPYNKAFISHEEIVNGGKLVFTMGPEPNKEWGLDK